MILGQTETESLYPFDDLVEAGEPGAGGDWDPPGIVDKALDWIKGKAAPTYESIATDLEKRAAAAGAEGARSAGGDVESRVRAGLEPVERQARTMTYVLIGAGVVTAAAAGVLIYMSVKKGKKRR